MFRCKEAKCTETIPLFGIESICEECFRAQKHPWNHLAKYYKHCVLQEAISPEISRKLCRCATVERIDSNGKYISLFPVDESLEHRTSAGFQFGKCKLLQLGAIVAEAKHKEATPLSSKLGLKRKLGIRSENASIGSRTLPHLDAKMEASLDQDIPLPVRGYVAEKFPLGNAHISLMLGPLVIEIGVPQSKGGILITSRDPLHYFVPTENDEELPNSLAIRSKNGKREIFTQRRTLRTQRRLKACMKQIVSGAFSGFTDTVLEDEIISSLVKESQIRVDDDGYTKFNNHVQAAITRLHAKIKRLLGTKARIYLERIANRLFDPSMDLQFHKRHNNCQIFTDNLVSYETFGPIFAKASETLAEPLYLLSFVCRPEGYHRAIVQTKYDVPHGLTEEYVLRYRSGRHDDADIFDSLSEYWHDWGAFGGHLYKNQDVFPWDCTEAYKKGSATCNNCNISRHVWAFPFDSWSIAQLHMQKDRRWYQPSFSLGRIRVTDKEWMENRLKIMLAQDALLRGAVAMANVPSVRTATEWMHKEENAQFDRLRLGGIHRAQPCSHHFEQRRYIEWYIATWAHLKRNEQIKAYEKMRDYRIQMQDVPKKDAEGGSGNVDFEAVGTGIEIGISAMALPAIFAPEMASVPAPTFEVSHNTLDNSHTSGMDSYGGDSSFGGFGGFGFQPL